MIELIIRLKVLAESAPDTLTDIICNGISPALAAALPAIYVGYPFLDSLGWWLMSTGHFLVAHRYAVGLFSLGRLAEHHKHAERSHTRCSCA
jgi:hypothetical protein